MRLASFDSMSSFQADILQKGRTFGGICTISVYTLLFLVLVLEMWSYLIPRDFETRISLDENSDSLLQLNVDITMHKIDCRNLRLVVKDSFGDEPLNTLTNDFSYRPVSSTGAQAGAAYRERSRDELDKKKDTHEAGAMAELDADWDSSHDGFKHSSFKEVVQAHDFIFVNFFATWCPHCRHFAPAWAEIADQLNKKKWTDADGKEHKVLLLKVNCVDFENVCFEEGVDAYPTLMLYKNDGTKQEFEDRRMLETIEDFIQKKVHNAHFALKEEGEKGCNIRGRLLVPRVPGRFAMEAGGTTAEQGLQPSMANVSHTISHLSFSDPEDGLNHRRRWRKLPKWVSEYLNPMDGKSYTISTMKKTLHHYVKIVSTQTANKAQFYQFLPSHREGNVAENEVPEMRIIYDLEPMMVHLNTGRKAWYDFLSSLFGIVGGIYVTVEAMVGLSRIASGKLSRDTTRAAGRSGILMEDD